MGSINSFRLTPVLCTAFGAAAGYYILFHYSLTVIITVLLVLLVTLCFFRVVSSLDGQSRKLHITSFNVTALSAGLFIGLCAASAGQNNVNFGIPQDKITGVEGVLLEDPRIISGGRAMVSLSLRRCAGAGGLRVSSSGEVIVFFTQVNSDKLREFGRGTTVFTEGAVRSGDLGWTVNAESLHIVKPASAIERMRTTIRLNLISLLEKESWGGLTLALLLGIKDNLDSNFTATYRNAGLSYILALSGMHLAILAAIIAFILKKPLGLKASAITGGCFIFLYCFLVGPAPSLNRAALMYMIGVIAILGTFPKNSLSVLSLSFLIQIIITPAAGNTLSFILSYLALLGILIIGKALASLLAGRIPDFLLQPLSMSVGAFLATCGICSFTFGLIAPAGIIAGLLIVPLTTFFMIGSVIWLILNIFSISFFLNLPLSVFYRLMETIASAAGNIPGISANPYIVLALSFVLILLLIILECRRKKILYHLQPFL